MNRRSHTGPAVGLAVLAGAAALWAQVQPAFPPIAAPAATQPVAATQPASPANPLDPATQPAATTRPTTGPAAGPAATIPATGPAAQLTLNFKDTPVDAVLDYLSEAAGFVVVKEGPVDGRVAIVSKKPVTGDEAAALLSAVLRATGHTATVDGRVLKVSARDKAKKGSVPVYVGADPSLVPAGDALVTQVIPILNVDASRLRQELQPLLPQDADVTSSTASNAIIITDSGSNIRRIVQVIAALDNREAASMDLKRFPLKYASASQTAKLLTSMFRGGDGGAGQMNPQMQQQMMMEMQQRGGGGQPMPQPPGGGGGGAGGKLPGGAVEQALKAHINAVADDRTNTLFVTAPVEVLKLIEGILKDLDSNPIPTSQLKAFPLKFADAESTAKTVSDLIKGQENRRFDDFPFFGGFPGGGGGDAAKVKVNVTHDARTNSVLVSAPAEVLKQVEELINTLDANPAASAELRVFQLKYADAWTTSKLIKNTFAPDDSSKNDSPFRFLIFGTGDSQAKKGPKVTVSSDDRTNSIIVTGPTELMKVIEGLIKQIDANPAVEESMFIYHLRNAQSAKLEVVLNTLFGNYDGRGGQNGQQNGDQGQGQAMQQQQGNRNSFGGGGGGGDNSGGTGIGSRRNNRNNRDRNQTGGNGAQQGVSPGLAKAITEMAGEVLVVADRDTNSLIVTTASKYEARVKQIIAELDRPVPQVLIKVLVAEVTHDDSVDLGVDFSVINRRPNGQGTSISSSFGNSTQTLGLVVSTLEDKLNAQLHLLANAGKLDVLSRPYIVASDNQLASITVGNEVPFITNTRITDTGQQINTIQYQDVGIILNVTPHINPDGLVILDVVPEISQLTGTTVPISEGVAAPVIAKRSAESRVGVRSGQTIVIGGLMQDQKTSTVAKIPILGDIPIVGWFFTRTQVTKNKTELLFFITPHVAQQPDALEGATQQERQGLEIAPRAVSPGKFEQHIRDMDRGAMPMSQPSGDQTIQPIGPPSPTSRPGQ